MKHALFALSARRRRGRNRHQRQGPRLSVVRQLHQRLDSCSFVTFAQCMADVSGIGGFCERNTSYHPRSRRRGKSRALRPG